MLNGQRKSFDEQITALCSGAVKHNKDISCISNASKYYISHVVLCVYQRYYKGTTDAPLLRSRHQLQDPHFDRRSERAGPVSGGEMIRRCEGRKKHVYLIVQTCRHGCNIIMILILVNTRIDSFLSSDIEIKNYTICQLEIAIILGNDFYLTTINKTINTSSYSHAK